MRVLWSYGGRWILLGGAAFILLALALNASISSWMNSGQFRGLLDRETSKGLKMEGRYSSLNRVGVLGLHADSFDGTKGYKTMVSLQARPISGTFNPLGILLRRWEIDNIHIQSGSVMLQKVESTPGAKSAPGPPWYLFFWPNRIYLEDVKVDDANVLFQLREKESGIYGTFLEITPNGRDYEYDARGGDFKTPATPPLKVVHAHMLIRKPKLTCPEFILGDDDAHPERQLRLTGEAGLQEDRSIKLAIDLVSLRVSPWLPEKIRPHVMGNVSGHLDYASTGTGIETGEGRGTIQIANGVLHALSLVRQYAMTTGSPDPGDDLALKVCQCDLQWKQGALTAENLQIECENVFRLEGTITIAHDQSLSGQLEFGLTDPYLKWLPTAKQSIFTRNAGGYHFATVHLTGTIQKPQEDLSSRIEKEIEKSPLVAVKLLFHQTANWLDFD